MSPLLTTGQSRWALHILLGLLSVVVIASSAPSAIGGVTMLSGNPGDIRGIEVLLGSIGLGGVLVLRTGYLLLPRPWRIYLDRVEFAFVAMLWICWTSATMAFSRFILKLGICSTSFSELYLPTCPLLTFDLILLHLLSITTLSLLLVILSIALSPGYHLSLSDMEAGSKADPESMDAFVMWDLALASPPTSPRVEEPNTFSPRTLRSYGTVTPVPVMGSGSYPQPGPSAPITSPTPVLKTKDKFAEGRLWSYIPLLTCSLGGCGASIATLVKAQSRYNAVNAYLVAVGAISCGFASAFLVRHYKQRQARRSGLTKTVSGRHDRALEIALAGALFLLWPLAAIILTLFPPTLNRPCTNPASSFESPDESSLPSTPANLLCLLTTTTVTLAWLASWIILFRVMGLIVPMPEVGAEIRPVRADRQGEEGRSLLRSEPVKAAEVVRPQMKWGRMVAGEAFELGGDDDEDQE